MILEDSELRRIPMILAGANCTGEEERLADCPGADLGGSTDVCGLRNVVALSCFTDLDEGTPWSVIPH